MGSTNHGTQTVSHAFYENITAANRNARLNGVIPRGIYSGGYLTRVTDSEITLSPLVVEIGDSSEQVRIQTASSATLNNTTLDSGTISSSTPYIILRWAFVASIGNYMEVHALSSVSVAQANDVVVGKCVFVGSTLSSFSYTERTFLNVQETFLKPQVSEAAELYIRLRAGRIQNTAGYYLVPEQKVGPFVTPSSPNSRIDLVYIDSSGVAQILQGTAAPSPTAPSYGGKLVIAEVTVVNSATSILASQIRDVRSFLVSPLVQKSASQAVGTTDITAPAVVADMTDMSITITTVGTKLLCTFSAPFYTPSYGNGNLYLYIDGVQKRKAHILNLAYEYLSFTHLESSVSPGVHTVKIMWGGTNVFQQGSTASERILTVQDL